MSVFFSRLEAKKGQRKAKKGVSMESRKGRPTKFLWAVERFNTSRGDWEIVDAALSQKQAQENRRWYAYDYEDKFRVTKFKRA